MTILVGYPINRRAKAVLSLAGMLARSSGEDLLVCTVVPAPWMPGLSRADEGYRSYIDESADSALAQARADLPTDVSAKFTTVYARSAPSGLLEAAEQHEASMIAVGSAAAGQFGYIGVEQRRRPVAAQFPDSGRLGPRGFRAKGGKVGRVTLAYTGGKQSGALLRAAETLAGKLGAELRLASFAVQLSPPETARFRTESGAVTRRMDRATFAPLPRRPWRRKVSGARRRPEAEFVIGHGRDWAEAFDDVEWRAGDVLMIGSSESGPIARVFLGSRAAKIVRHSPVPVLVVPRAAAKELSRE